jgi:hypothetical protein
VTTLITVIVSAISRRNSLQEFAGSADKTSNAASMWCQVTEVRRENTAMPYVLITSVITLFFAFTLGVFFLTLLKVSGPVPVPDVRRIDPRSQARDIPVR